MFPASRDRFQQKKKKKKWVPQFGPTLGRELGFLLFSQVWFFGFPLNYIG